MYNDLLPTKILKNESNKIKQHGTQNLHKTYTTYCKFCT